MGYAKEEKDYIETVWRWLHDHPELSLQTQKTSAYIANQLRRIGYTDITEISGGVIAKWDSGIPGPVFCLRSDIDALQFTVDGEIVNDHACGHDGHATILLTAAKIFKEHKLLEKGKLVLLFQPGEEDNIGALTMIKTGLLDDVNEMISAHLTTMPLGDAMPSRPHHGCAILTADIHGKNAHASAPNEGVNATEIACSAVNAMKTLTISLDPSICHSCKATYFDATGTSNNTIPDRAVVCWDIRSETNKFMEELHTRAEAVIKAIVLSAGGTVNFSYEYTPAGTPDVKTVALTDKIIKRVLGKSVPVEIGADAGGDDFHFYSKELGIPTAYIGLGANCTPMHVYGLTYDHKALEYGVDIYVGCALERLGSSQQK